MWLGKNESASFGLGVLTDLNSRGIEDIFIRYRQLKRLYPNYKKGVPRIANSNLRSTSNSQLSKICCLRR